MGNDVFLYCMDCGQRTEALMCAYNFNEELLNKKLDKVLLEDLIVLIEKFNFCLQKNIFCRDFTLDFFNEICEFYRKHKDHNLFLIDDYFEEKRKL